MSVKPYFPSAPSKPKFNNESTPIETVFAWLKCFLGKANSFAASVSVGSIMYLLYPKYPKITTATNT